MTLRHLNIFLAIYETGSTTGASERLLIAQPTVSIALKELEEHYQVPMFERYAKRLRVTEAGKELYQYAKHLVSLFDETESVMQGHGRAGTLRIGSSITIGNYFLPRYIRQFQLESPQTQTRVIIENTDTIEKLLLENELDLALVEGEVSSPFMISRPYRQDHLVVICSPAHPYAQYQDIIPEVLAAEPMILREKGSAVRELFDTFMSAHGLVIEPVWQSVSTQAILRAVKENLGLSFLPYYLAEEDIRRGEIVSVPVAGTDFIRNFNIIFHRNKFRSASLNAFIRICETS